jgi:hypothetical protein
MPEKRKPGLLDCSLFCMTGVALMGVIRLRSAVLLLPIVAHVLTDAAIAIIVLKPAP